MDSNQFEELIQSGLEDRWAGSQAVVVRAEGTPPEAQMWLFERKSGLWRKACGPRPAAVGRGGMGKRAEGDGRSPSGAFLFGPAFGWAEKPEGMRYPYRALDALDRWVDDPTSPFYNRWVRGKAAACGGGEDLSKVDQYAHAVAVRCNDEAAPHLGSAIFLHVWKERGMGTQGCTAISEEDMRALLKWLDYSWRPVLLQGTEEEIALLMEEDWNLLCLPESWGFADDFIPDAQLEIRYNTVRNFMARRVPGYQASAAPMRLEAIAALERCAGRLRGQGLGVRIYDAYRPQLATDAMIAWAEDAACTAAKAEYYPDIDKADIPDRFVARRSNHRLGGTVDVTLLGWANGRNLDMGGNFDFFGERSAFAWSGLAPAQAENRALLRDAMVASGFLPLEKEWWHFAFPVEGEGGDFVILPREHDLRRP